MFIYIYILCTQCTRFQRASCVVYVSGPEIETINVDVNERLREMKIDWSEPQEPNKIKEYYIVLMFEDAIIFNITVGRILSSSKFFNHKIALDFRIA